MDADSEYELANPPSDGVSSLAFFSTNLLLVSSWDYTVNLYDVAKNTQLTSYRHSSAVLDCCFSDKSHAISGGLDQTVKIHDFETGNEKILGNHDKAVRKIKFSLLTGLVISGSWDNSIKLWDPRLARAEVASADQAGKVFAMDLSNEKLVVGTSNRHVFIWDVRNISEPLQQRESSLKYQTRAIATYPNHTGYALSSVEGRVAMEYFDPSPEVQKKKYAFKCHRKKDVDGVDVVYPVNSIAFHPSFGTFATGGCDGLVSVWDGENKKRLYQFRNYPAGISSLAFNFDGSLLAIASSYTFEEGEKDHPADQIFIRTVSAAEMAPRARTR